MKERPILFSAPMVRAILEGRKTVTRRVVKPAGAVDVVPFIAANNEPTGEFGWCPHPCYISRHIRCPYGRPGDRLWVRETWGVVSHAFDERGARSAWQPNRPATQIHDMPFGHGFYSGHAIYAADGHFDWCSDDDGGGEPRSAWKPSIHMPRVASRITLEVTGVQVERLQDISEADAIAEGVDPALGLQGDDDLAVHQVQSAFSPDWSKPLMPAPVARYVLLWDSINGKQPGVTNWNANPWVWCVSFKRVTP